MFLDIVFLLIRSSVGRGREVYGDPEEIRRLALEIRQEAEMTTMDAGRGARAERGWLEAARVLTSSSLLFRPTDGPGLRADLLLAVTDAFASSQLVEGA